MSKKLKEKYFKIILFNLKKFFYNWQRVINPIINKEYTVRMHCFGLLGWGGGGDITGKILNLNSLN